ncbi:MAG: fibronectin type III domain-containing protein, partial [Chloroflexota bacterium]|nr:fibronectin type III domain-containing protein [Chloroflexota bacterium]
LAALGSFHPPLEAQSPPPLPPNVRIGRTTHNSLTMLWDESPGATSYEVGIEEMPLSPFWRDVGNVSSYTFTGLDYVRTLLIETHPNFDFAFYVRAKNSAGHSNGATLLVRRSQFLRPFRSSRSSRDDKPPPPTATPTPKPVVHTLNQLPPGIQVNNWVQGAQGRRVSPDGLGRADLVAGMLDAVDIWGHVTPGVEVCFDQPGSAVFLDAAYAPRRLSDLTAYSRAGMTCATIDRAGTVVLLRGDPPPQETQPQEDAGHILDDCELKPLSANLNFRRSPPDGPRIDVIWARYSGWLRASEKRAGYFKVRYYGAEGWVSGDYVQTRGDCGA